ncbi:MAG: D-cysteine desulfhydrase family protein [Microthrixaceae bacterium]|nr:D-cysteine desulfhydrase family protein [Microthrixaceae bacterium]
MNPGPAADLGARLGGFPRFTLLGRPTPLEDAPRLSELLGVRVLIKRDDLSEVGLGGNKLRKLEFLLGDALAAGCDTLVTFGALQSNHARQSAAACARAGIACHLVLTDTVPRHDELYRTNGNLLLDELFGARIWFSDGTEDGLAATVERVESHLAAEGSRARWVPPGGSEPLGALGYVSCALELSQQCRDLSVEPDQVFVASATAGTHAGLLCGLRGAMATTSVRGVAVLEDAADTADTVVRLGSQVAELLGVEPAPAEAVHVDGGQLGAGYGIPTDASREATGMFARTEGIVLDPVYTSKTAAGLVEVCRDGPGESGAPGPDTTLVFVHTGGSPGLFAYGRDALDGAVRGS